MKTLNVKGIALWINGTNALSTVKIFAEKARQVLEDCLPENVDFSEWFEDIETMPVPVQEEGSSDIQQINTRSVEAWILDHPKWNLLASMKEKERTGKALMLLGNFLKLCLARTSESRDGSRKEDSPGYMKPMTAEEEEISETETASNEEKSNEITSEETISENSPITNDSQEETAQKEIQSN